MENTPLIVGIVVTLSVLVTMGFLAPDFTKKVFKLLGLGTIVAGGGVLAVVWGFIAAVATVVLSAFFSAALFTYPVAYSYRYLLEKYPSLPAAGPFTIFVTLLTLAFVGRVMVPRSSNNNNT